MTEAGYKIQEWPKIRNLVELFLAAQKPYTVYGHGDCDVTLVLEKIAALKKENRIVLSLNTYLVYVVSRVAVNNPALLTFKQGQKSVVFDHADVGLAILKKLPNGVRVPVPYIVRSADTKSLAQINAELKTAIRSDLTDDPKVRFRRKLAQFPRFIQKALYAYIFSNPLRVQKFVGNVGITNLQNAGYDSPMIGMPPNIFTGQFAVGNVSEQFRPDKEKKPVLRKILSMSAGFDHLVMDGMSIAAIAKDFTNRLDKADGIDEAFIQESLKDKAK